MHEFTVRKFGGRPVRSRERTRRLPADGIKKTKGAVFKQRPYTSKLLASAVRFWERYSPASTGAFHGHRTLETSAALAPCTLCGKTRLFSDPVSSSGIRIP